MCNHRQPGLGQDSTDCFVWWCKDPDFGKVWARESVQCIDLWRQLCKVATLDQLCMAILSAFDFTAEHLYEFCMDNKMYSEDCYYLLANAGIIGIPCVSLQVMCIPAPIAGFLLGGGVRNQLVASAKVVQLAHQIDPDNKVGCMCAGFFAYPYTCDPNDFLKLQQEAQAGFYLFSDVFVRGYYPSYAKSIFDKEGVVMNVSEEDKADLTAGKVDYMAFSYYNSSCITTHEVDATVKGNMMGSIKNPYLDASEWGWQIDPVGFKRALHELYDRYQLPLLVIENGLGAQDTLEADGTIHDPYRVDYMKRHIAAMKEAVEEGVDLMGYTMWSCIDLVSAGSGELRKRYGFVYVDAHDDGTGTFKRYRKDSFWWYKKVIESNGEDLG